MVKQTHPPTLWWHIKALTRKKNLQIKPSCKIIIIGDPTTIHLIIFEKIDEELIIRGAVKTKGGSGPSGIDADS